MGTRPIINKGLALIVLFVIGCTPPVRSGVTERIAVQPAAEKTICVQADRTKSEIVLITKPLEAELVSKGYKVVEKPDQAAYTMRLDIIGFRLNGRPRPSSGGSSAPAVGMAAGTAAGSAASGNILHTTSTGGNVGGIIGLGAGLGAGLLLSDSHKKVLFVGNIDVGITDPSKTEQKTLVSAWRRVYRENEEVAARHAVASKLASMIAALMP